MFALGGLSACQWPKVPACALKVNSHPLPWSSHIMFFGPGSASHLQPQNRKEDGVWAWITASRLLLDHASRSTAPLFIVKKPHKVSINLMAFLFALG